MQENSGLQQQLIYQVAKTLVEIPYDKRDKQIILEIQKTLFNKDFPLSIFLKAKFVRVGQTALISKFNEYLSSVGKPSMKGQCNGFFMLWTLAHALGKIQWLYKAYILMLITPTEVIKELPSFNSFVELLIKAIHDAGEESSTKFHINQTDLPTLWKGLAITLGWEEHLKNINIPKKNLVIPFYAPKEEFVNLLNEYGDEILVDGEIYALHSPKHVVGFLNASSYNSFYDANADCGEVVQKYDPKLLADQIVEAYCLDSEATKELSENDYVLFFLISFTYSETRTYKRFDRFKFLQYLLDKYNNINLLNLDGYSLLHLAVKTGDIQLVQFYVENGANINQLFKKHTPLSIAFRLGCFDIANYLMQKDAKISRSMAQHLNLDLPENLFLDESSQSNILIQLKSVNNNNSQVNEQDPKNESTKETAQISPSQEKINDNKIEETAFFSFN